MRSTIAICPDLQHNRDSVLAAILSATDYAVLFTDLDHNSVACNNQFGTIFRVEIDKVVTSSPEEVRKMVASRIPDWDAWTSNLHQVYDDPMLVQEDELDLANPVTRIRRYSGPVLDESGEPIGRIWTFQDVTTQYHQRRMREALQALSVYHRSDPAEVIKYATEVVGEFYQSNSVLSILVGDYMDFRATGGPNNPAAAMGGNPLRDAYCQFCLRNNAPILIQDARENAEYNAILPATVGLTRYLGVPIFTSAGDPIGTLCILDDRSHELLSAEDLQFVSLVAMRVGSELEREKGIQSRLDEKQRILDAQAKDLQATQQVLHSITQAFELMERPVTLAEALIDQTRLLRGLLDFEEANLLYQDREGNWWLAGDDVTQVTKLPDLATPGRHFRWLTRGQMKGVPGISSRHQLSVPLREEAGVVGSLIFGANEQLALDAHRAIHLEAVAEQVSLLLGSLALRRDLEATSQTLQETTEKLIRSEKLAVTGTLAASVAHDIRNIVASISLELSMSGDDPAKLLDQVRVQLDRFSVLAHRLLAYAKPRVVVRELVRIHDVAERVFLLVGRQLEMSMVDLEVRGLNQLPTTLGDPSRLEHLLVNLIMNSIQAMPEGGRVRLTGTVEDDWMRIDIADTGRGIAPAIRGRLFEPFASTRNEGFGLGLYSCQRIVEDQGGDISVTSTPGHGTTFTVRLPIV